MRPDTLSIILRSASFIALLQTAGMAIFIAMFGRSLALSLPPLQRFIRLSAIAAAALLLGQYLLEAARMADTMAGIADPSLQMLAMHSASSVVLATRLVGLIVITAALARRSDRGATLAVVGSTLIAASFMLTGHTAAHPLRLVLAPLLTVHVFIVAFWFGALIPLYLICRRETSVIAARVTAAFSQLALWLVPGILLAGLLLGLVLIRHLADMRSAYGLSLLAKISAFALLMGIAAFNKWRLGPAIASGDERVLRSFRRSLQIEYLLIAVVLSITAQMTTLYSPEP